MSALSDLSVVIKGKLYSLFGNPVVIVGLAPSGDFVPLAAGASGALETQARGALTENSGTIASGGTSQLAAASNPDRRYFVLQNVSAADLWFTFGVAAAVQDQPSIKLVAGAFYENPPHFCPIGAVKIIGAITGQAYTCKEA